MANVSDHEALEQLVNELYDFKRTFYTIHRDGSSRDDQVLDRLKDVVTKIDGAIGSNKITKDNCFLFYLKGKALNIKLDEDTEAKTLLQSALKLMPQKEDLWVQLSECYHKEGDLKMTKNCLDNAYKLNATNTEVLKNLSILVRMVPNVKGADRMKGVELAIEATKIKPDDGSVWTNLGNGLISSFFLDPSTDSSQMIVQAKAAYEQAEQDAVEASQPDFLYNYSNLLQFNEEYQGAVDRLNLCIQLDPKWKDPQIRRDSMIATVKQVAQLVGNNAGMKAKRVKDMMKEAMKPVVMKNPLGSDGDKVLKQGLLSTLKEGDNDGFYLSLSIMGCVNRESSVCITLIGVDGEGTACAISMFNVGKEPMIGDVITMPHPQVKHIKLKVNGPEEEIVQYTGVRVDKPTDVLRNGKPLPTTFVSRTKVSNIRSHV